MDGSTSDNLSIIDCSSSGIVESNSSAGGLIGEIENINNINLEDCYNEADIKGKGSNKGGGIIGSLSYAKNATVTNCHNTGTISGYGYIGGVVGEFYNVDAETVKNCSNIGKIDAKGNYVGGITGRANGTAIIISCKNTGEITAGGICGGIVGSNEASKSSQFNYCYNTANILATSGGQVGGIIGYISGSNGTVNCCYNTGDISGSYGVGGIVGNNAKAISNCYNTGNITGTSYGVGGIAGEVDAASITNAYNKGIIDNNSKGNLGGIVGTGRSSTIDNVYNIGEIKISDTNASTSGAIVGYISTTITNCYYLKGTANTGTGANYTDMDTSKSKETTDDMKALMNSNLASKTEWSTASGNNNDGYPVLNMQ